MKRKRKKRISKISGKRGGDDEGEDSKRQRSQQPEGKSV